MGGLHGGGGRGIINPLTRRRRRKINGLDRGIKSIQKHPKVMSNILQRKIRESVTTPSGEKSRIWGGEEGSRSAPQAPACHPSEGGEGARAGRR